MADITIEHADTGATVIARPQPIGVFPLPAGYLLIPDGPGHDDARTELVAGRLPAELPEGLGFYRLALDGDLDAALDALVGDDLVARINRFVLDPAADALDLLLADVMASAAAGDNGAVELRTFVETIAFVVGLRAMPPAVGAATGEFASLVYAAHATAALEARRSGDAADDLESAAQAARSVSPALTGQLMGQLANVQLDEGGTQRAAVTFQAAIDHLEGTELFASRAELHVAAGAMFQEMSEAAPRLMQQAIDHYHQALALVNADVAPETVAIANANLGLAYLMMPMNEATDLLRTGVAVQSMREALNHFTPETHYERWSSTQLNLANALVYMPSTHQADNIAEAIGLYEGVLQHRTRERDPQGRARVLANQGNALAHLGVFDDAKSKLHEARSLFEEFEDHDAVMSIRGILDEVAKQESIVRQDAGAGVGDGEVSS
ncbi:MAG: hypothetical protein AAFP84_03480 [Actinomycetota bacterium]